MKGTSKRTSGNSLSPLVVQNIGVRAIFARGSGKLFAQKILASCSGLMPPNFEHNYVAIDKHLEKLLP